MRRVFVRLIGGVVRQMCIAHRASWEGVTVQPDTDPSWEEITTHPQVDEITDLWVKAGDGTYSAPVPLAIRRISSATWWDRWTDAESVKLEQLAEANTNAGRQVRAFFRAVQLSGAVDLDKPQLATKLSQLAALMLADGIWANQATADARIAALLADG